MKKANHQLLYGIMGLVMSSIILFIADRIGSKFDPIAILIPYFVFTINGIRNCRYVKK